MAKTKMWIFLFIIFSCSMDKCFLQPVTNLKLGYSAGQLLVAFNRPAGLDISQEEYTVKYHANSDLTVCTEDNQFDCNFEETFANRNELVLHHLQAPYHSSLVVAVKASSLADSNYVSAEINTTIGVPRDPPYDVEISSFNDTSASLKWENASPLPGPSNYMLTAIAHFTEQDVQQVEEFVSRNEIAARANATVIDLIPEYGYYITVQLTTVKGASMESKPIFFARKPKLLKDRTVGPVPHPTEHTQFYIYNPCSIVGELVDMRGGPVKSINVYVRENGSDCTVNSNVKWSNQFGTTDEKVPSYLAATITCPKNISNFICKTKTDDNFGRSLTSDAEIAKHLRFTIGDEDCSTKTGATTCNGPLPTGRSYQVAIEATRDNWKAETLKSDACHFSEPVTIPAASSVVAPVVGASSGLERGDILALILGLILLLILLLLLLFLLCPCIRRWCCCCCCCFGLGVKDYDEEQQIETVPMKPMTNKRAILLIDRLNGLKEKMKRTDSQPIHNQHVINRGNEAYADEKDEMLSHQNEYDQIIQEYEQQKPPQDDPEVEKLRKIWQDNLRYIIQRRALLPTPKRRTTKPDDQNMMVVVEAPQHSAAVVAADKKERVIPFVDAGRQQNVYNTVGDASEKDIHPTNPSSTSHVEYKVKAVEEKNVYENDDVTVVPVVLYAVADDEDEDEVELRRLVDLPEQVVATATNEEKKEQVEYEMRIYREENDECKLMIEEEGVWLPLGKKWNKSTARSELRKIAPMEQDVNYFYLIPFENYHTWKDQHFAMHCVYTNDRGLANKEQFFKAFKKLGVRIAADDLQRLFDMFAGEDDGLVDYTKFFRILHSETAEDMRPRTPTKQHVRYSYNTEVRTSLSGNQSQMLDESGKDGRKKSVSHFVTVLDGFARNLKEIDEDTEDA